MRRMILSLTAICFCQLLVCSVNPQNLNNLQENQQTDKERKEAEKGASQQAKEEERKRKDEEKRAEELNKDFLDASKKCQVEKVRDLLRRGANINARDKQGRSALFASSLCKSLIPELLKAGVPVDDAQGDLASFALVWALENNQSEYIARLLSKGVTAKSEEGEKALARALKSGNESLVSLLLSHLAPLPDRAVAFAAQSGNAKLVNSMLDRGANIYASETLPRVSISEGRMSMSWAPGARGKDALMYAVAKGDVEIVRILLARGADPVTYTLVYEGGLDGGRSLLSARPQLEANSLDLAASLGHAEIVKLLLEKTGTAAKLTTPLTAAALGGHADVLSVLLGRVSDEQKVLALTILTRHIEGGWQLTGFEGYRKESRVLFLAQALQTTQMQVLLAVGRKLARDELLKKAEAEGLLPSLQLLEGKPQ